MTPRPLRGTRDNVVPFRHRGKAVRYRRRHPLVRLARPFLGAVLWVGLPLALTTWLLTTPRLALAAVTVDAEPSVLGIAIWPSSQQTPLRVRRVSSAWVQRAIRPLLGTNLLRLDLATVAQSFDSHPWVQTVEARKELPHRLRLRIVERAAAALLHDGEQLLYVDPNGAVIAPLGSDDPAADLVVLSLLTGPDDAGESPADVTAAQERALRGALRLVGELAGVRPDWAAEISEIELMVMDDYRLIVASIPFPLLVRAGTLHERIRRLEALVPQIAARYGAVKAVDLRFARRIIVQPTGSATSMRS
jgi:cell division septal protein FtsQ